MLAVRHTNERRLRAGLICRSRSDLVNWQICLEPLLAVGLVDLVLIVECSQPIVPKTLRTLESQFSHLFWAVIRRILGPKRCEGPVSEVIGRRLQETHTCHTTLVAQGRWSRGFDEPTIAELKKWDLDFLLNFAPSILRGEVLSVPKYGVWSFHHGDERKYRGTPAGFWELYHGENVSGAVLQRLTDRLDSGVILKRCTIKTDKLSYRRNHDALIKASAKMPACVCRDIVDDRADYILSPPSTTKAPVYRSPTNFQVVRFLGRLAGRWLVHLLSKSLYIDQWNVGVVSAPIRAFIDGSHIPAIEWLPTRGDRSFLADPFGIAHEDGHLVMMEDWDWSAGRAQISSAYLDASGNVNALRPAIAESHHFSYPFLIKHQNRLYCVPETYKRREVALYCLDEDARKWSRISTLVTDFAAADATVVQHNSVWWLFCTSADDDPMATLYVWSSPDLEGPWRPHPRNPVKIDVTSSRPGGTPFVVDGILYRPAQDNSKTYGGRITVNRVAELSERHFSEEPVAYIEPGPNSGWPDGIHTLSSCGARTLVDGKRRIFMPQLVLRRLILAWRIRRVKCAADPEIHSCMRPETHTAD